MESNTSLVGVIGVLMVLVTIIGNTSTGKFNLKADMGSSVYAGVNNKIISEGKQVVDIGGKQYIIDIRPE